MIRKSLKSAKRFWDGLGGFGGVALILLLIGLIIVLPIMIGPARTTAYYCCAAIVYGVIPKFWRLRSKDERYFLSSVFFDFRGLCAAAYPIAFSFLHNCSGLGYFFVWFGIAWFAGGLVAMILMLVPLGLRFIRVGDTREKEVISRFLLVTGFDQTDLEALWVEDEAALVFAFHDEFDWTLYRWDIESPDQGSRRFRVKRFRFGVILIGHCPPMRWVNYQEDLTWLEAMWERHHVDPESPPWARQKDKTLPAYTRQVRRFFTRVLWQAKGFPNAAIWEFRRFKKRDYAKHPRHVKDVLKRILRAIPESARFYRQAREEALEKLREIDPTASIEEFLIESDPAARHVPDEAKKRAWEPT